jgi:hypothetical protein
MVKKNRKEKIRDLAKSYEPTPQERAALEAYRIQEEESPLAPRLRVTENDGATTICPDHPKPSVGNVLLMDALGTRDWDFLEGFLMLPMPDQRAGKWMAGHLISCSRWSKA